MNVGKSRINNGHWEKKKWSSRDNTKYQEINTKHLEIYTNIERSIQTSRDLLMLLFGDLQMFSPKFIEKSKSSLMWH